MRASAASCSKKNRLERMSRGWKLGRGQCQTSRSSTRRSRRVGRGLATTARAPAARRWQGATQGALTTGPVTIVSNVHSAEFRALANSSGVLVPDYINPTYVNVTLRVSVKSAKNPIVISDGFCNLRNLTTQGSG